MQLTAVRARDSFWKILHHVLLVVFLVTAALNMLDIHGGFLTNYAADLVVPAWLYVVTRGLHPDRQQPTIIQKLFGRTPEIAASSLFIASTLTELRQRVWPNGPFAGRFDIFDIVAYGVGLASCYAAEKFLYTSPVTVLPDVTTDRT